MKKLLELRKDKKKRNPRFVRTDAKWKLRLPLSWRKPRGWHNKIRLQKKGYNPRVKPGYRTPALVRNLTNDGKQRVIVQNLKFLSSLNKDTQVAIFASTIGKRKRQTMLEEAKKMGIRVMSVKNVDVHLDKIKKDLDMRKQRRKDILKKRESKKEKKKESKPKKEKKSEEDLADKVEKEKEQKQKTLTKRV